MREIEDVEETLPTRFGPFVLLSLLGQGGMGRAYLARHPDWAGRLVIKRMHTHLLADEGLLRRFEHEARVATYVKHVNVAALVAMGTVENEPFFATEHVLGLPIAAIVERVEHGLVHAIPIDVAMQIAVALARGVEAIHEAVNAETGERLDLVHRDLGARNVLLGVDGQPRIIDLGLGKSILSDWQTATNMLAGSPDYMPPEQAMGKSVDRRADVYATAVTIWELFAGRKRINEPSIAQRISRAIEAQPEPLLTIRPDAPPRLERTLMKAMEPNSVHRTPTMTMFRTSLERELEALGALSDVSAWFAEACATALAKETRLIEEAEDVDLVKESAGDRTQILVAHKMFVSGARAPNTGRIELKPSDAPASARKDRLASAVLDGEAATESRAPAAPAGPMNTELVPALAAQVVRGDVELFGKKMSQQTALVGAGIAAVFALALALLLWPSEAPVVAPIAPVPTAGPFAGLPAAPVSSAPASTAASPSSTPTDVIEPDLEPEPIPASVITAKRELVERIRVLRKANFSGEFQRTLTALSTRVSRARTEAEIAEITARVSQLERQ